jgi:hypothetical protein
MNIGDFVTVIKPIFHPAGGLLHNSPQVGYVGKILKKTSDSSFIFVKYDQGHLEQDCFFPGCWIYKDYLIITNSGGFCGTLNPWLSIAKEQTEFRESLKSKDISCAHSMKEYIGLTEKYLFCINCDKKEEIN